MQDTRAERMVYVCAAPAADGAHDIPVPGVDAVVQSSSHAYKCWGGLDIRRL